MKASPPPHQIEQGVPDTRHGRILGQGEMADIIRVKDWSQTPLGPIETWSETLLSTVNMILSAPLPMQLLWGPELIILYNDALKASIADKHPSALGGAGRTVWEEAWPAVGQQLEAVLSRGESVNVRDVHIPLRHHGRIVDTYWSYSYSPVYALDGSVAGILDIAQNTTEAVLARLKLVASEALANRVLESIGDAVIVTDQQTCIVRMNPVAQLLTGWSETAASQQKLSTVFHIVDESTREAVASPADNVIRVGTIVGSANHTILISRDGTERFIEDNAAPIRDENGLLAGIVLVFRDIGERRQAELEKQKQDERLELALSAANGIGIWDWDIPGDRVYTDANFARMYGVDPKDGLRGVPLSAFTHGMHPGDRDRVGKEIVATMVSGTEFSSEYRLMQEDGSIRWVYARGRCTQDAEGKPLRFPGVTVDITQRVAIESALRSSEERLRIALETAQLGSWTVDFLTKKLDCSDVCRTIYGRTLEEPFTYADLLTSVHAEDWPAVQAAVRGAIRDHAPFRCEYRAVWPNGEVRWIVASGRITYDADDVAVAITGVSLDVTERHLANAALIQTEKLAAVGRLAASIAHEINNPLESVTNLLYLARTAHASDIQEYLATAERELRRVSVISNQTLRFYKQATRARAVTCTDLFESVLSIYQGRLLNSHIAVARRKRARQPIECFEGEIRQVLNNLVGNAIDAMHPGGGTLLIRSRESHNWKTGQPGVTLTVADTGTGMAPSTLKRIFEAFYTTKGIGGTGLGLWVSKEIIDRHGGTLHVRSAQQERASGSVFTLFLPFAAVAR